MALVAVDEKKPVRAWFCVLVEVLKPRNSMRICRPAVVTDSNGSIARYGVVFVPGTDVDFAREDDVWRNCPRARVDALDHRCQLPIAWLN